MTISTVVKRALNPILLGPMMIS